MHSEFSKYDELTLTQLGHVGVRHTQSKDGVSGGRECPAGELPPHWGINA